MEPQVLNDSHGRLRHGHVPQPFVLHAFFDAATCRRIREAMDAGVPEPADVLDDEIKTDVRVRSATHVEVDGRTLRLVEDRLDSLKPALEQFFGVALGGREGTSFLRYQPGDFFRPHTDRGDVPSWPAAARRRIAIVVFLNSSRETEVTGMFAGGLLTLHPHGADSTELALPPRMGTVVAFPADRVHEVTPVRDGVRDTIVDWVY